MGWVAIADAENGLFDVSGLEHVSDPDGNSLDAEDGFLARGSVLIETRLSPDERPQTLLAYERSHPWAASFSLQAIPGGGIAVVISQAGEVFHAALNHDSHDRADILRVTYSWDAPRRWGRLAIERPEFDKVVSVEITDPKPLLLDDLRLMATEPALRYMDEDLLFFAVSDQIEPIGPMPTLFETVPLQTGRGFAGAGQFRRGDLVQTMESGLVPVLGTVSRVVPAKGSFEPVRLRAPYFGLQQDIIVAPDQRMVIGGPEVEYMFGHEAVLVPARHLVNGVSAISGAPTPTVTYHQLILPAHESMVAAGCPVESLYLGRIRRKPEQLGSSLLAPFRRSELPEHARSAHPMLRPFEAITLAQNRAA